MVKWLCADIAVLLLYEAVDVSREVDTVLGWGLVYPSESCSVSHEVKNSLTVDTQIIWKSGLKEHAYIFLKPRFPVLTPPPHH